MREVKKMNAVPEYVMTVLKTVRQAGFSTYLVGGAVRDIIMGRTPTDYDIASSALPEQIMSLFAHTIPTGIKHGTVTVIAGCAAPDHEHPVIIGTCGKIPVPCVAPPLSRDTVGERYDHQFGALVPECHAYFGDV